MYRSLQRCSTSSHHALCGTVIRAHSCHVPLHFVSVLTADTATSHCHASSAYCMGTHTHLTEKYRLLGFLLCLSHNGHKMRYTLGMLIQCL